MSSPRRISDVMTSIPSVRAAASASRISSTTAGPLTLPKITNRRRPGTISRKSSSRLAATSVCWIDRPVTLPPGRANDDRDDGCRLLGSYDCLSRRRDNDVDFAPDKLGRDLGEALAASLRPAILDRDGATLDPAKFAQALHKSGNPLAMGSRRTCDKEPNGRQFGRL